jgi:hypothetical protein
LVAKKAIALKMATTSATEGRIPERSKISIKKLKPSH